MNTRVAPIGQPYQYLDAKLPHAVTKAGADSYGYDAERQRIKKSAGTKTTRYFGNLVEIEREGDQETITKYYYAEGMLVAQRRGGTLQYAHQDHLDSLRVLSDASGAPVATREFAAFGEQVGSGGTATLTRGYGAHWQDGESGLIYMGARYYDPVITRVIQPDPVVPEPDDPQSWNRYSFVRNNPFNRVDPTGSLDTGVEIAERWQASADESRQILETAVSDNPGLGSVVGATAAQTAMDLGAGFVDMLRVGEGTAQGGWGIAHDAFRAMGVAGSAAQTFRTAGGGLAALSSRLATTRVAGRAGTQAADDAFARASGMLRDAAKGKGNFGIGSAARSEADDIGRAWVGPNPRVASDGRTLIGRDGLRQYRPPSYKPALDRSQANLEGRLPGQTQWQSNAHIDILD